MSQLTAADFQRLLKSGDLANTKGSKFKANAVCFAQIIEQEKPEASVHTKKIKKHRAEAKQLGQMKMWLKALGIKFESEYKFHQTRKWRFDIAIVENKIAIEYEGIFSEKSGHTTHKGFLNDVEKYNTATTEGWTVLRYTVKNYQNIITDVESLNFAKHSL